MILIDKPRKNYSHMVGSSIEELHAFAKSIGVKRCWFENKKGKNRPHYDVAEKFYSAAIAAGAIETSSEDIVKFCIENYGVNTTLNRKKSMKPTIPLKGKLNLEELVFELSELEVYCEGEKVFLMKDVKLPINYLNSKGNHITLFRSNCLHNDKDFMNVLHKNHMLSRVVMRKEEVISDAGRPILYVPLKGEIEFDMRTYNDRYNPHMGKQGDIIRKQIIRECLFDLRELMKQRYPVEPEPIGISNSDLITLICSLG